MLLKKNNWWLYLILNVFSLGLINFVVADQMNLYDKNAWYSNKKYWIIGTISLIIPALLMFTIFLIEMSVKVATNLEVDGYKIFNSVYTWILCLIIPIIGWIILIVMYLYINVFSAVFIYYGKGERFI